MCLEQRTLDGKTVRYLSFDTSVSVNLWFNAQHKQNVNRDCAPDCSVFGSFKALWQITAFYWRWNAEWPEHYGIKFMCESGKIFFFMKNRNVYHSRLSQNMQHAKKYSLGSTQTKYRTVYDKRHLTFTIVKHTLHYTVFLRLSFFSVCGLSSIRLLWQELSQ